MNERDDVSENKQSKASVNPSKGRQSRGGSIIIEGELTAGAGEEPPLLREKVSEKVAGKADAKASRSAAANNPSAGRSVWPWLLGSMLLLALLVLAGYSEWRQQQTLQQLQDLQAQIQSTSQQAAQQQSSWQSLDGLQQQQKRQWAQVGEQLQQQQRQLSDQGRRLQSLATTNRDDWLLAEAEYLLRLANQRQLMERGGRGAQALLQTADNILRDLDRVDLFAVRRALAADQLALAVAGQVDREKIFSQLSVVNDAIRSMPLLQLGERVDIAPQTIEIEAPEPVLDAALEPWQQRVLQSFQQFLHKLRSYIRIREHNQPLQPLLSPAQERLFRQNISLLIEQAQLALLREEQQIYQQSLARAAEALSQFVSLNEVALTLVAQLETLAAINVVQSLPDISGSLEQLKAYSERLHRVDAIVVPETPLKPDAAVTSAAQIESEPAQEPEMTPPVVAEELAP